jgi:molybdate transport system substrate-binding protein
MKRNLIVLTLLALLVCGCRRKAPQPTTGGEKTLTVLCGGGIRPAMEATAKAFEAASGCKVKTSYAGSGTLLGQLQAGVEADIFLPGDIAFIDRAREKDMVQSHATVAWFVPVIAVQKGNPKGVKGLADLAREEVSFGLGKADACAAGSVARDVLTAAGLLDEIKADFEALTVNRLANQIKLKALDAAIIWDATAKQYPADIDTVPIEDANFHAVPLAVGVLKQAQDTQLAQAFSEFASGNAGATAFRENHYTVPGKKLRIGCGSSMRPPTEDLAKLFEDVTGCETLRDYGGSGTVLLQLEESKDGDIYICHDPFAYTCEDRKISERWHTIAHIEPTLAVLAGNPKKVTGFKDLLREDLKLGLPHRDRSTRGKILWTLFAKSGIKEQIESRKFFESRTHDLINQLKLKTVDIAVLWDAPVKAMADFDAVPIEEKYKVDSITSATSGRTHSIKHVKVTVVRLNFSKQPLLAAQFARLCQSPAGQEILRKHCFTVPTAP